jgi:hypothetical protein
MSCLNQIDDIGFVPLAQPEELDGHQTGRTGNTYAVALGSRPNDLFDDFPWDVDRGWRENDNANPPIRTPETVDFDQS